MSMSDERLAEIEAMEQAATDAPWWFDESDLCWRLHGTWGWTPAQQSIPAQPVNKQILKAPKSGTTQMEYWPDEADGAFIVGARTAVPELIEEIKRLRAKLPACNGRCLRATDVLEPDQMHNVVGDPVARAHRSCLLHGEPEAYIRDLEEAL